LKGAFYAFLYVDILYTCAAFYGDINLGLYITDTENIF